MQHKTRMLCVGLAVTAVFLAYFVYRLFDYDGVLNVNAATKQELVELLGMPPPRADAVLGKRRELGQFADVAQFRAAWSDDAGWERCEKHLRLDGPTDLGRVIYKLGPSFRQAKWGWLWAATLIHMFSFVLRAWRWQVLLKPVKRVGFWQSFNPVMVGFTCNTLLPMRAGEFARPAVFAVKEGVAFSATFATVVLERVFDMLAVVTVLGITVLFLEGPAAPAPTAAQEGAAETAVAAPDSTSPASASASAAFGLLKKYGRIVGPVALAAVLVFFAVGARPALAERIIKACTRLFPHALQDKLIEFVDKFIVGLQTLESKRDLFWLTLWTALVWVDIIVVYWTAALSFGIPLSFLGACLCFVLAAAAVAAPQAPGFIGPFQVAVQSGLAMLAVDAASAASYAIMLWLVSMVPTVILGLACMALGGISLADVRYPADGAASGEA